MRPPTLSEADRAALLASPCLCAGCDQAGHAKARQDARAARLAEADASRLAKSFAVPADPNACWLWMGCRDKAGYGLFSARRQWRAHRYVYEQMVWWPKYQKSLPSELTLHHTCEVRACVNPAHLEPMSGADNSMLSGNPMARNARKTHAPCGHPYTGRDSQGIRHCRPCRRKQWREWARQARERVRGAKAIEAT